MNKDKILIVEDELIAAESLSLDLNKLGYEVMGIVTSGEKAIEKTIATNPDVILMDIHLKGKMDGIHTAEKIMETFHIPIIYLTAYADVETIERAKATNPYGYLVKPYKLVDIRTTISMAIAKAEEDKKIKQSLEIEKKLNEIKTKTLARTSHDLRNPLTNILGYTELLKEYGEKIPEEKKEKYFNFIINSVTEMNDSLEELLLISKADEGKLKLYLEEFDLISFLQEIVEMYQNINENHHVKLITNAEGYLVFLDKTIFRHILNNLLSNAIKYSPQGGEIKVELKCNDCEIMLRVEDQGIGIPESYKDKLFTLFERADNVGSIKGNGLGLSIVKKAVELQNGIITVESKEGKGSKFVITIPQQQEE